MTKTSIMVKVTCDNPKCGKSFWRKKYFVDLYKYHYCSLECRDAAKTGPIANSMFRMVAKR